MEKRGKAGDNTLGELNIPELTREQWIEFCHTHISKGKIPDDYWSVVFNSVSESKILLKSFNAFSEDQQKLLVKQLDVKVPVHTMSAYIDLCNRAEEKDSRLKNCVNFRFYEMSQGLEYVTGPPSDQLKESMQKVIYATDHLNKAEDKTWPGMLDAVIFLLRIVYDEEKLIQIFDSLTDRMDWLDPYCLILLAEKWDQVSEMPIDWAVQWVVDSTDA